MHRVRKTTGEAHYSNKDFNKVKNLVLDNFKSQKKMKKISDFLLKHSGKGLSTNKFVWGAVGLAGASVYLQKKGSEIRAGETRMLNKDRWEQTNGR
jgi:hypothetical protein